MTAAVSAAQHDRVSVTPKISVCVATYRRPRQLGRLLHHLADLDPPGGGFEVVVVDDGSPAADGVAGILAAAAEWFPVPLRWELLSQNSGRAGARNRAWRMAAGEWVAFTDDDCRPDPKWLSSLMEVVNAPSGDSETPAIVQGRVLPDPERSSLLSDPLARSLRVDRLNELYQTANIFYRRDVLEEAGGFDDGFPGAGEDTELGWRVRKRGHRAAFAGDAVVIHDVVVRSFREDVRDRKRWGDVVQVVKLHPETRRLAWRPRIYRKSHIAPILAVAGLPLVAGGPLLRKAYALGLVVGLSYQFRDVRTCGALVRRAQLLIGDCYEVGVLVRSSIRQRTVLL